MTAYASVFEPRGPVAAEMTFLMWVLVVLGAAVFVAVVGLLVVGLVRRTEATPEDTIERRWLGGGGLVLPALLISVVFALTLSAMRDTRLEPGGVTIGIVGHQWWWEIHYDGFSTANELVIPAGEPVTFEVASADVIHSFWIPGLGGKIDMLPDTTNTVILEATEPGEYGGACGEFCGIQHARMRLRVIAVTPDEYANWTAAQLVDAAPPDIGLTADGLDVFMGAGCGDCHTIRGTSAIGDSGPDLTHLASRETLAAVTLPNDAEQLGQWIRSAQSLKHGVAMPDTELSERDLEALVAYLGTLR